MMWMYWALLAPAIYAICNFFDAYIVSERVQDNRGMMIYSSLVAFVFATLLLFFYGNQGVMVSDGLLIALTGVLTAYALIFYYDVLSRDEASNVMLLMEMTPAFALFMAFILLDERISGIQLLGFCIILSATIFLGKLEGSDDSKADEVQSSQNNTTPIQESIVFFEPKNEFFGMSRVFWLMMLADLLYAGSYIVVKFVSGTHSLSSILIYESYGMAVGAFTYYLFSKRARSSFHGDVLHSGIIVLSLMIIEALFFLLAKAASFRAYSEGSVALVSILGSTQPMFVILYGFVLTVWLPKIFREDISFAGFAKKMILGAVMIGGIWLVS